MTKFDHLSQLSNLLCDGVDEVLQKGCPVGGCGFPGRACGDEEDWDGMEDPFVSKDCLESDLRRAVHSGVMADRVATIAREHHHNLLRHAQKVLLESGFRGVTITSVEDGPRYEPSDEVVMDDPEEMY